MALIDKEEFVKRFCSHCIDYGKCPEKCFDVEIMESEPTVDAVPVVRCNECIHWNKSSDWWKGFCKEFDNGYKSLEICTSYNFYCGNGESKD